LLYEFINSHVLKIRMVPTGMVNGVDTYRHEPTLCEHCKAKDALDLLNGIIQTQVQKLREYEEMMAIDHERITSLQQQLASCNVDLHNSKQHELGLMCGDLQYKLNEIKKLVEENRNIGLADFLAVDILEILES
jgi:tRNA U34 5-carboxymethylaminomethyl modifying GTPase MnmE/TrmE